MTDEPEHPESWSPETAPAEDSKELRLMGKVWRALAQGGGRMPEAIARRLANTLLDKGDAAAGKFPGHLMRERRLFLEMLSKQDQHSDRMLVEEARLARDGAPTDGHVTIELPKWAAPSEEPDGTTPTTTDPPAPDDEADHQSE